MHGVISNHCSQLDPVGKGKKNYKEYKIRENVVSKMFPQSEQSIRKRGNIKN